MKYATKTEASIKNALLDLLQSKRLPDVTVSELARKADVSRSTFYQHYGNPADVYDALVADLATQVSPMIEQIACSDSPLPSKKPFCALVRDGAFGLVANDDRFLSSFMSQRRGVGEHDMGEVLIKSGYSEKEAQALCAFQLSGCFSAARTIAADADEWEAIRAVIDRFILGGLSACLAAKSSPSR